jgi:ATP/ADP translocase
MIARFFGKLLAVNPDEWPVVLYFFFVLLMFSFGASFARSIGMTLLIEKLGGDILPFIFILIDLSVMVGSLLYAHYTNKYSGLDILGFFLLSTALFSVIAQLLFIFTFYWWPGENWIYGVFFVGFFFFYILISIHIGSVVASYFTAVQIKRLMSVINTGLPIGGVLGGTTLVILLSYFQVQPQLLIMVLGVACLGAFGLLGIINKKLTPVRACTTAKSQTNPVSQMLKAFKDISGSKLMIYMSIGLMLFVITSKLLEYHYQAIIYVKVYPDPTERATFFATYEIFANLAWLFIQLFLTSRIILKFGVGGSNLLYPILSTLVALALFIYFFLKATGDIQGGIIVMLALGVITQFINQEMRGALRTPANNMLFNAIPPEQWGSNKAFLNGIIFPLSTLIAGTLLIMITGTGNESSFNFGLSEQTIYYLLPLIALIFSLLAIAFAFPQWTYYDKGMFSLLNSDVDSKGDDQEKSLEIQVIQQKLTSSDIDQVVTTLKIISVKKQKESLNQVGNLLLKTESYLVKTQCLLTLNAFPPSHTNLMYLGEALETETDERVLPLILKNLARFRSNNLNQIVTKLLAHPSHSVFIEAALCLYHNPKFERKIWIETEIKKRLKQAKLPNEQAAYLYALGELQQSKYSNQVSPFLDNKNPKLNLAAFRAFIKLQHGNFDSNDQIRLKNALNSNDKAIKIEALHALKDCYFLTDWSSIIQLLDDMDEEIVKESKGLLELNLAKCKPKLIETLFSNNLSVQKRFEVLSLIYPKLNEEENQALLQDADMALQKFTEANALLKLHESLEHQGKAYDLIAKVLQEIAEDHLDHILTIITYVSEKNLEFFQRVSHGLKSSNRANQGNALEVLSNSGEKYLVGRILKYYEERLNDVKAIGRVYITLFNKILKVEKKRYEELLLALDNDIIKACLLYIQQEKTGKKLELKDVNETVRFLLTPEDKPKSKTKLEQQRAVLKETMMKILNKPHFSKMLGLEIDEAWKNPNKN